jgi:geranylgeranyl diphosphate synthase type I
VLLARAEAAADAEGRRLLARVVGDAAADEADITAAHELMVATGAVASVAADVRRLAAQGQEVLAGAAGLGALGTEGLGVLAGRATDVSALPA